MEIKPAKRKKAPKPAKKKMPKKPAKSKWSY